jgi:hypothetical protein
MLPEDMNNLEVDDMQSQAELPEQKGGNFIIRRGQTKGYHSRNSCIKWR